MKKNYEIVSWYYYNNDNRCNYIDFINFILFDVRLDVHDPFGASISILGFQVEGPFQSDDTKAKLIKFLRNSVFDHDFSRVASKRNIYYVFKL
jgi:hypothetical protein